MSIVSTRPSFWSTSPASRSAIAELGSTAMPASATERPRGTTRFSSAIGWIGALLVLALAIVSSGCGSSSRSFGEFGTGTTATATVTSISVEPTNTSLPRGLTRQFTAMALYSDGTKLDVSSSVTWTSSATNIATVNTTGVVTAANLGSTTVSAAIGLVTGSTSLTVSAATLVSIDVTPVSPTIAKGTLQLLTATGIYTDYSTQNITTMVTWTSSNPLVATISNAPGTVGLATGVAGGMSTMTATLGAATGSTVLTVSGASLVSINVTPTNPSIAKGAQQQFTATGVYTDGTQLPLTNAVTWSSSTTVATISNVAGSQGLATATAVGSATISAAAAGLTGSTTLTVTAASLLSITVTPANPTIPAGLTQPFVATGTYSDGTTAPLTAVAVWNSATPAIATITNAPATSGIATGVTAGTSVITATVGAITSAPVTLTVTAAALVSIAVTPVNPTIVNGATLQFVATGTYTDGTTMVITNAVTWNSATTAVATISNAAGPPSTQGLATAASAGTTLITATYPGAAPITSPAQTLTVKNAYAYATNTAAPGVMGTVSQYSIGLDGTLMPLTPNAVNAGINAFSIAINTAGTLAYVANYNKSAASGTISQYSISPVTGALASIGTPVPTVSNPNSVTIDPNGQYVYYSNNSENTVGEFVIQPDGTLANPPGVVGIGGALFSSGLGPASVAINPADTYAYVANYGNGNGNSVSQYMIGGGGALQAIPGEPLAVAAQLGPSYVIVDPTGRYVYVANQSAGTISEYSIQVDGSLLNIGTTAVAPTGNGPSFIAINAQGTYVYVADSNSDDVSQYAVTVGGATAGQLTLVGAYSTGANSAPYGVTIDATGKWLYVAERITAGVIAQFAISPVDGTLTPLAPPIAPAGAAPTSIATTP